MESAQRTPAKVPDTPALGLLEHLLKIEALFEGSTSWAFSVAKLAHFCLASHVRRGLRVA
jgi:hypothetical protein